MEFKEGAPSRETKIKLEVNSIFRDKERAKENLKLVTKNIKNTKFKIAGNVGIGIAGIGTSVLTTLLIYEDVLPALTGSLVLCSSALLYGGCIKTNESIRDLKKLQREKKIVEKDIEDTEATYKSKVRELKNIEDSQDENFNTPDGLFKEEIQKTL